MHSMQAANNAVSNLKEIFLVRFYEEKEELQYSVLGLGLGLTLTLTPWVKPNPCPPVREGRATVQCGM